MCCRHRNINRCTLMVIQKEILIQTNCRNVWPPATNLHKQPIQTWWLPARIHWHRHAFIYGHTDETGSFSGIWSGNILCNRSHSHAECREEFPLEINCLQQILFILPAGLLQFTWMHRVVSPTLIYKPAPFKFLLHKLLCEIGSVNQMQYKY